MRPGPRDPSPERWARIRDLFDEVVDLDGDARREILERECAGDPELRSEVESLVASSSEPTGALDLDAGSFAPTTWARSGGVARDLGLAAHRMEPGSQLGPYELGRALGSGGMGQVYEARRRDGALDRPVAIKLLWSRADGSSEQRFIAEGRALAALAHPNIARVFEAGSHEGLLYLAIERLDGGTLTEHCRSLDLSVEERVDLFCDVCAAVDHANQQGVIHRDLKPSNVMVDDRGRAKLLDFGIAAFVAGVSGGRSWDLRASTTEQGEGVLMTPAYAAPEQLLGDPVTPATDVYALGLMLYEVLTGQRAQRFEDSNLADMMERITETDPPLPSEVFGELAARDTPLARLQDQLRGDLDTIIMKAIRKKPAERYATAGDLAGDLRRWREGRPIRARPQGPAARLGKWIRRHSVACALALALLLVWASATWILERQRREADRERLHAETEAATAREVSDLVLWLFESSDPSQALGEDAPARELLASGEERLESIESDEVREALRQVLDDARRQLDDEDGP